ncbi:IS5 family transposase [Kitasatospora griseola]|uniref:IS5 family transposase n=1 Tax=Kitasatospora griseola TaxID=2064 RepID=UPI00381B4CD0
MLEPLLPVFEVGRRAVSQRELIDGVRWRVRTGAPWRDLPAEDGPWQTVYGLFRRWQRHGVWSALFTALQARADANGLIVWEVNVDSTICRAHRHAAGAPRAGYEQKEPPRGVTTEPDDHGLGRARGGWTMKIHRLDGDPRHRPSPERVDLAATSDLVSFGPRRPGLRSRPDLVLLEGECSSKGIQRIGDLLPPVGELAGLRTSRPLRLHSAKVDQGGLESGVNHESFFLGARSRPHPAPVLRLGLDAILVTLVRFGRWVGCAKAWTGEVAGE